jgi:EipB-like
MFLPRFRHENSYSRGNKQDIVMTRKLAILSLSAAIAAAIPAGSAIAGTAATQPLAAHRAVYDVKLKDASDRSGITGMTGRIVYEFQGTTCDGYTTNFRFVTRIRSSGGDRLTDQQTSTYEDAKGKTFSFVTKSFVDEKLDRELSGTATNEGDTTVVDLKKPEELEFKLESALFPTAHINDLLARADSGETIYEKKIFDGSEDGDRVMTTTVILGPEKTEAEGDAVNAKPLDGQPYRHVSISYFDDENKENGEELPEYAISFKLYENGVTRDLVMDYGDFVLTGALKQLDLLPQESCR